MSASFIHTNIPNMPLNMNSESPSSPAKWRAAAELQLRVLLKHTDTLGVHTTHGNLNLSCGGHLKYLAATAAKGHQSLSVCDDTVAVLLPGWGGGIAMYTRALPALVKQFSVVFCLDLPGMGMSTRSEFPDMRAEVASSVRFFTTRLESGLSALRRKDTRFANARRRVLGAHSLGGYIAVEWMLANGMAAQLFHHLVLIAPAGVLTAPKHPTCAIMPHTHPLLAPLTDLLWNKGVTPMALIKSLPENIARQSSRAFIAQRIAGDLPVVLRTALAEYLFQIARAPAGAERAMCTLLHPGTWGRVPLCERLPLLRIPTGFIQGEGDWMHSENTRCAVAALKAPSIAHVVPRAGHNVFLDNATGFADAFATVCEHLRVSSPLDKCVS